MLKREQIEDCIEEVKIYLRLQHWTVRINWDETCDDEGAIAMVMPVQGRFLATVVFCSDILERDTLEVSNTVTHELLHLHSHEIFQTTSTMLSKCSIDLQDAVSAVIRNDIEKMTDALATAFVDIMGVCHSLEDIEEEDFEDADDEIVEAEEEIATEGI